MVEWDPHLHAHCAAYQLRKIMLPTCYELLNYMYQLKSRPTHFCPEYLVVKVFLMSYFFLPLIQREKLSDITVKQIL